MKNLIGLILLLSFKLVMGQHDSEGKKYDFSGTSPSSIDVDIVKSKMDSILSIYNNSVDSMWQLLDWVKSKKNIQPYVSIDFGWGSNFSTLKYINGGLINSSLESFSENLDGFHLGFTGRGRRLLIVFEIDDLKQQIVQNNTLRVGIDAIGADFTFGWDILNKPRFQVYPNASLSFQSLYIDIHDKKAGSVVNDISSLLTNYTHTLLEKNTVAINYGIQVDYHLVYTKRKGGIILGIRCGLTNDLNQGKWRINGEKSSFYSDDRFRDSYVTGLIKFYRKIGG